MRLLASHLLETNGETPSSDTKKARDKALVYEFPCLKDNTAAKGETALKMPTLLAPSIYRGGGKVFRPTTVEAQRSFIDMQPVGTNMVEYIQNQR